MASSYLRPGELLLQPGPLLRHQGEFLQGVVLGLSALCQLRLEVWQPRFQDLGGNSIGLQKWPKNGQKNILEEDICLKCWNAHTASSKNRQKSPKNCPKMSKNVYRIAPLHCVTRGRGRRRLALVTLLLLAILGRDSIHLKLWKFEKQTCINYWFLQVSRFLLL